MTALRRRASKRSTFIAFLCVAFLVFLLMLLFDMPAGMNVKTLQIDVSTGRVRYVRRFCQARLDGRICETWVSQNLDPKILQQASNDWRELHVWCGWIEMRRDIPWFYFCHRIDLQIALDGSKSITVDLSAKRKIASSMVILWQKELNSEAEDQFLNDVANVIKKGYENKDVPVTAKDIPDIEFYIR